MSRIIPILSLAPLTLLILLCLTLTSHSLDTTSPSIYDKIINDEQYLSVLPGIVEHREWPFETEFPLQHAPALNTQYRRCGEFPVLGLTCVELYTYPQNLTLHIRLLIQEHVILDKEITASQVCLDQKTLLQLLEFIPALMPFKKLIDMIIRVEGFIPAKLFSVCVNMRDLKFTKEYVDGCTSVDASLMCWKGSCLYKGTKDYGCWHVVFGGWMDSDMMKMMQEMKEDMERMRLRMEKMEGLVAMEEKQQ